MIGVIAIGFSGYFRGFKVGYRVFYGFWVGFMSVGPPQGDSWVFGVSLGVSLGF